MSGKPTDKTEIGREETALHKLQGLVVGGVVEKVEGNSQAEGMFTLFVRKDGVLWEVPIFGTDMGWWTRGVQVCSDVPLYPDPEVMFREMVDFVRQGMSDDEYKCYPMEDFTNRRIGFRATICSTEDSEQPIAGQSRDFWIPISGCRGSPWMEPLSTPEGRRWIAGHSDGARLWERADPRDAGRGSWRGPKTAREADHARR